MQHRDRWGKKKRVKNAVDEFIAITVGLPIIVRLLHDTRTISKSDNKIGLDLLTLADETLVDLVALQKK